MTSVAESRANPPRPQPAPAKQKRPRRSWIVLAAIVVLAILDVRALLMLRRKTPGSAELSQSPASYRHAPSSPRCSTDRDADHHSPGSGRNHVKQGDLLVEFDRQAQMRDIVDKQADYEKLVDQVAEEQAKEDAACAMDETELQTTKDNLRKMSLRLARSEMG